VYYGQTHKKQWRIHSPETFLEHGNTDHESSCGCYGSRSGRIRSGNRYSKLAGRLREGFLPPHVSIASNATNNVVQSIEKVIFFFNCLQGFVPHTTEMEIWANCGPSIWNLTLWTANFETECYAKKRSGNRKFGKDIHEVSLNTLLSRFHLPPILRASLKRSFPRPDLSSGNFPT
jgi:hypothetical protein